MKLFDPEQGFDALKQSAYRTSALAIKDIASRGGWLDGRDPLDGGVAADAVVIAVEQYGENASAEHIRGGVRDLLQLKGEACLEAFAVGLAIALRDNRIKVRSRSPRVWEVVR